MPSRFKEPRLFVFILTVGLGGIISSSPAQDTQAKYQRKSISYVDALLPLGDVYLNAARENYLLDVLRREIEMPRFDLNPLPEKLLSDFRREIRWSGAGSRDELIAKLNEVFVPEIVRILDFEKEMRARGLVTETERHSFIVEKAKEEGITAQDLETVMNSAYLYLPVISGLELQAGKDEAKGFCHLQGALWWFVVKVDSSGGRLEWLAEKSATGIGLGQRNRRGDDSDEAFYSAAQALARDLRVRTQQMPEFMITHPLTETGADWVEFAIGRQEGVKVDDKYVISEFQESQGGALIQKRLGLVRITRVADNRGERVPSRARTVIGGSYMPGMLAQEHPRLPLDLSFRFALNPVKLSPGSVENLAYPGRQDFSVTQNAVAPLYVGQFWLQYNLAPLTGISQLFVSLYGELGGGQFTQVTILGADAPAGFYRGLGVGLGKKYFFNRFFIGWEGLLSLAQYGIKGETTDQRAWEWKIWSPTVALAGNLEVAVGYDWNIGIGATYRLSPELQGWKYSFDGNELSLENASNPPQLNFSGWGTQIYLTWSVAAFAWDPFTLFRWVL